MATGDHPTIPEEEQAAQEHEGSVNLFKFLAENRPDEEEALQNTGDRLTEPLRRKLRKYTDMVNQEVPDISQESLERITGRYSLELERTLQDGRSYVELANRAYATGRLTEEIIGTLPRDREPVLDDLDRVYRMDLDLDEFKTYNDLFGHKAGDDILQVLSDTLRDGESIKWLLEESEALPDRDESKPAVEFTSEGGEEFGGMVVFREGITTKEREQIMEKFSLLLQDELHTKFQKIMTETDGQGNLVRPIKKDKIPRDVELPEDFVMETGASVGYASAKDVVYQIPYDDKKDSFYSVINKIRSRLFETSDSRSQNNKEARKDARWEDNEEGSNFRYTAEISPRGRAERLKLENEKMKTEMAKKDMEIQRLKAQLAAAGIEVGEG